MSEETGNGRSNIFICTGGCNGCDLSEVKCPYKGKIESKTGDTDHNLVKLMAKVLRPRYEQLLFETISHESIVTALGSELFKLAQSYEILEEAVGKKITRKKIAEDVLQLIPASEWSEHNEEIRKKFAKEVGIIARKILEIKRRACKKQGIACDKCYMNIACLQKIENM